MNLLCPATASTTTTATATRASSKLALACRYRAHTAQRFLSYAIFFCHQAHHNRPPQRLLLAPKTSTLSLSPHFFPCVHFLTGNSPFFRMEVISMTPFGFRETEGKKWIKIPFLSDSLCFYYLGGCLDVTLCFDVIRKLDQEWFFIFYLISFNFGCGVFFSLL